MHADMLHVYTKWCSHRHASLTILMFIYTRCITWTSCSSLYY